MLPHGWHENVAVDTHLCAAAIVRLDAALVGASYAFVAEGEQYQSAQQRSNDEVYTPEGVCNMEICTRHLVVALVAAGACGATW